MQVPTVYAFWFRRSRAYVGLVCVALSTALEGAGDPHWSRAQAVLAENCARCHGVTPKSELDVRTIAALLRGGKRGPALVPGNAHESHLLRFVLPGAEPHMPPGDKQLPPGDIEALRVWIDALTPEFASAAAAPLPPREAAAASSAWVPPSGVNPGLVVDLLLEKRQRELGVAASAPAGDAVFVRRLYLDLAGRIPTAAERQAFLENRSSAKREELADVLLAGEEHARRLREVLSVALLGRDVQKRMNDTLRSKWHQYLESAFHANRPWSDVVRDSLVARPHEERDGGAIGFLHAHKNNHQNMAESVGSAFLGVQVGCAKCHDHPVAPEIRQAHYWGLVAFLSRTRNVDTEKGPALAEAAIGGFDRFSNLKGEAFDADLQFLDGTTVPEARPGDGVKEVDAPEKYLVPPPADGARAALASVPRFSRREKLAETVLARGEQVSRSAVNRVWALVFGRGLVHPVDRMDSAHPPSHPELLDWLAEDFRSHGYNLRRLLRALVLTKSYALSSQPVLDGAGQAPPAAAFAFAMDRPLTAESLARSLLIATETQAPPAAELERTLVDVFPDVWSDEPSSSLRQALFLSNNPLLSGLTSPAPGNLAARLLSLPAPEARVEEAFLAILGREGTPVELARAQAYLDERSGDAASGLGQLLWALLTSAEFFLNH